MTMLQWTPVLNLEEEEEIFKRTSYITGYDVCSLPKDPGSCSDWEVRWFFNTEIQRCDRFWYGGCNEGNANNFMEEKECLSKCTETSKTCFISCCVSCKVIKMK